MVGYGPKKTSYHFNTILSNAKKFNGDSSKNKKKKVGGLSKNKINILKILKS